MTQKTENIKVGIITMHKVLNFGSALQAFALQYAVERLGYECEIIDYVYPNKYHRKFHSYEKKWKSIVKSIIPTILLSSTARDNNEIKKFWKKRYKLSRNYKTKESLLATPPVYDIFITGSDQVWNTNFVKGDTSFLLSFVSDKYKKISYSPSFATAAIDSEFVNVYKRLLSEYKHISVRETSGLKIVKDLTGQDAVTTLDPTFLLDSEEWTKEINLKDENPYGEYIFAYILDYAVKCIPYVYDFIKHYQSKLNCKVIYLDQKGTLPVELEKIAERPYKISPENFVSLFKNAKLVITSSFHGTAFSVNFGKSFFSIINKDIEKDSRQFSLLSKLGVSNRAVIVDTPFDEIDESWNMEELQSNLLQLRELSKKYLSEALRS